MAPCSFRFAVPGDEEKILTFIRDLAEYEKMAHLVEATPELLHREIFERGMAEVIFAVAEGEEVGFALFFHNFSTFLGRPGIYLEDLFVLPRHRGKGYGKALLTELARLAAERGCGRLEWSCLDWNTPSIDFYTQGMRAVPMDGWTVYRLTGERLEAAARRSSTDPIPTGERIAAPVFNRLARTGGNTRPHQTQRPPRGQKGARSWPLSIYISIRNFPCWTGPAGSKSWSAG